MLTEEYIEERYEALLARVQGYNPGVDIPRLRSAYDFAREAHKDAKRKDGSPYVSHPLEVAHIVIDLSLDIDSVIAALLHDTIEDSGFTYLDVKSRFGTAVADLVDGVTKLTRVPYSTKEEQQMENLRKMFLAMARDIRVILIKICDRLHNMRTIEYHTERKRREKSLETMEIYAPLAHRLGMQKIKWELEDLSLQSLDPVGYQEINEALASRPEAHSEFLPLARDSIAARLKDVGIEAHLESRVKHIYSIYRKMYSQHKALYEIYDLYAVRVIVKDLADCYNVLGFIHDLYKPIPGRFKDYISTPKPNMYRSLHTTVIGRDGIPFEVQIRTWEMHHTAEYGIAAHWKYKEGLHTEVGLESKLEWVRRLLETQQDTDAEDFIRSLKVDMFADEVFVFTPKGDVINLPAGANPIDFAYAIHSAVGNRMTGAKVNGRIVPLDYHLKNGDIVEILAIGGHGPSRDWIKLVKTSEARNKIKQWFKRERRDENITQGKAEFDIEVKRGDIPMSTLLQEEILSSVLRKLSFASLDELYAAIGYGGMSATRAVNRIRDELIRLNRLQSDKSAVEKLMQSFKKPKKAVAGVIVAGLDNCLIKFARCCAPVPGDKITGFVTRGYGVSIHRQDCPNVSAGQRDPSDSGRWVNASWSPNLTELYQTALQATCRDRAGLVVDVATLMSSLKVRMQSLSAREIGGGYAVINLTMEVSDLPQLQNIVSRLSGIQGVIEVERRSVS